MPLLVLESHTKPFMSPFNFIPFEQIIQHYKLQILSSVPFQLLRPIHDNENSIIIEFTSDLVGISNVILCLRNMHRPVIVWIKHSTQNHISELLSSILVCAPLTILVIVEEERLKERLDHLLSVYPLTKTICLDDENMGEWPATIWKSYLELLSIVSEHFDLPYLQFKIYPDTTITRTVRDLLAAAASNDISDATRNLNSIPLYDDFIYYPNAVVANHLRYKIPYWIKASAPPESLKTDLYECAKEIRARKSLSIFMDLFNSIKDLNANHKNVPDMRLALFGYYADNLPPKFFNPFQEILDGQKSFAEVTEILEKAHIDYPTDFFYKNSLPESVIVCQSYPFNFFEAKSAAQYVSGHSIKYFDEKDDNLFDYYFNQIIRGDRIIEIEVASEDDKHKKAIDLLQELIVSENNCLAAIGVFYAMRRQCPVYRTHRAGRHIFAKFHELDELMNDRIEQRINDREASIHISAIEKLVSNLSMETTALLEPKLLQEVSATLAGNPRIFFLSDIPLDFVRINDDYLGYSTLACRLPITPGSLPLQYFNLTTGIGELENDSSKIVIVTSFAIGSFERTFLEQSLKQFSYFDKIKILPSRSKFELLNYVNNNANIECLIFFGHGGVSRETNQSWIQLQYDNFFNYDVRSLKLIPKTIVLIGCNTSSGGSTMCGMDIPFLQRGAHVIATTFSIPLLLGSLFIGVFLSNFISAGVTTKHGANFYTDLSEILFVVRNRCRIHSVLFNLRSSELLQDQDEETVLDTFLEEFEALENTQKGNHNNPTMAIRKTLKRLGFTAEENAPLSEIEKIPYFIFFTCLGYTWDQINKSFKT